MVGYPIVLNVRGKDCLVAGGGEVARRKILALLSCHAKVTVIAPAACSTIESLYKANRIKVQRRKYRKGDIDGYFLAIAATDSSKVNQEIAKEAHKQGILVNVADHLVLSTFTVPSVLRLGELTVAVSTQGKSPFLAKRLRERLEDSLSPGLEQLLEDLQKVREDLKEKQMGDAEKKKIYETVIRNSGLLADTIQQRKG